MKQLALALLCLLFMAGIKEVAGFGFFGGAGRGGGIHFDFGGMGNDDEEDERGGGAERPFRPPTPAKGHCQPGQYLCPQDRHELDYYGLPDRAVCVGNPRDCPCPGLKQHKCPLGRWYLCLPQGVPCPTTEHKNSN
jgi:hypothetical protein